MKFKVYNLIYAKVIHVILCDHSHNLSLDILLMWVINSTIYFWIELYLGRLSVICFNYFSFFSGFQLLHTHKDFWNDSILLLQSWCLCLPKTNMSKFFPRGIVSGDEIFGRPLSYKVEALSVTGSLREMPTRPPSPLLPGKTHLALRRASPVPALPVPCHRLPGL